MNNDLDTVKAIASLLNLADLILFRASSGYQVQNAQSALLDMSSVFGLRLNEDAKTAGNSVASGWGEHKKAFDS